MISKYQLKSPAIKAVQWTGDNIEEVKGIVPDAYMYNGLLFIPSIYERDVICVMRDYISKHPGGATHVHREADFVNAYVEIAKENNIV